MLVICTRTKRKGLAKRFENREKISNEILIAKGLAIAKHKQYIFALETRFQASFPNVGNDTILIGWTLSIFSRICERMLCINTSEQHQSSNQRAKGSMLPYRVCSMSKLFVKPVPVFSTTLIGNFLQNFFHFLHLPFQN